MRRGLLLVFEGSEGAGKTTQAGLLADRLRSAGHEVLTLREPGGTPLGDSIRSLLLDPAQHIAPGAEALLFMASRAQLVRDEVDPALERGVIVLMDRFFLSTYAYQIDGRGLPEDQIRSANSIAAGGVVPALTIVLDIESQHGMSRATQRGSRDRMEQLGDDFHDRVEKAFTRFISGDWQRAHPECGMIVSVDGRGKAEEVHERVVDALARNLPERFSTLSAKGVS
jgi:dTMP kinase